MVTHIMVYLLEQTQNRKYKLALLLENVFCMCITPVCILFFPLIFLRGCSRGQQCEQKSNEKPAGRTIPEAHEKVYRERKSAENEDKEKDVTARQITWARGFFDLKRDGCLP